MSKKDTKHNVPDKKLLINRNTVFRISAVLFLSAAVFFVMLLFGYSRNNKETASRLLYETAYQKAEGLIGALITESSYLESFAELLPENLTTESLFDISKYKGLADSIYAKELTEIQQNISEISVLEDGNIELAIKNSRYGVLCAKLSREKLKSIVDSGSFGGKSSVILYEVSSGNVVINTAKKHGFEGNKIGFILNHTFGNGFSATKMFSDIDDKKSGYTEIEAKGQKYCVCYVPVAAGDLYILMFAPKTAVYQAFAGGLTAVFLSVMLIICAAFAVLLVIMGNKRANDDRKTQAFSFEVLNTALLKLSEDDCIGIYIYRKSEDVLEVIKDLNSGQRGITLNDGFACLAKKTGVDQTDKRKLKNAVNLTGPGKDMRINVLSRFAKENVNTQITFSCIKQNNQKALVCVVKKRDGDIKDVLSQKEQLTRDGYNTTCIELFLERNMWHFLWNNEEVFAQTGFCTGMQNDYDFQLKKDLISFVKMSDRERVLRSLDRLSMLEAFRNGEFERTVVFNISDKDGHYSPRFLDVRIYRDNYNDEIKANFYIRNMPAD